MPSLRSVSAVVPADDHHRRNSGRRRHLFGVRGRKQPELYALRRCAERQCGAGNAFPPAGTLTPGGSQACAISVTSTLPGVTTISFTAADSGDLLPAQTASTTVTVLGHAAANVTVASGNGQRVMLGTTGLTAELTLANGTAGQSGLASLDVNSLGANLIGPTGGSLVASGLVQSYTASLTAGTTGTQTEMFSLNAGDDHTLSGASPPVDLSTSVALTVVANRLVTASSANFGLVHEGTAVGQAITLSTSGDDSHFTRVTVGNAGPDANGISVGGGSNPLFNGESVTDQRILGGAFSTIGTVVGVITLTTSGEGLSGEAPINVPVSYTAQVYSGKAQWNAASGDWNSGNWTDILRGRPVGPARAVRIRCRHCHFWPRFQRRHGGRALKRRWTHVECSGVQ